MKHKMNKEERAKNRERVRRCRERQAAQKADPTIVTDDEIARLPPAVKAELNRVTAIQAAVGIPDNLRARQEEAVRRLKQSI